MQWVALVALAAVGCKCLPEPITDASPPSAAFTIEFREPGGASASKNIVAGDPDITIQASKDHKISVLYSGGDDQGVRTVDLEYDMWRYSGNSRISPLLVAIKVTASCPKQLLLDSETFDPGGLPWQYKFTSRADNWVGASTRSATVTVRTQ